MAVGAVSARMILPNLWAGRSKLTGGVVTITTQPAKQITDNSLIYANGNDGNVTGTLTITRTSGTNFVITSSVGGDTGFVSWLVYLVNDATD